MHAILELLAFWALAFLTLGAALVLLNIFDGLIGNDLTLLTLRQEAVIAGIASLVEGASVWLVVRFVPAAVRALLIPAIIVAIMYRLAHLTDWSRYDVFMLLMFQAVIVAVGGSLLVGQFQAAFVILLVFGFALALFAFFARGL
jgi:hypothetical protein